MLAAASRPSRIAHTTSEAPRTMSPAANTPSRFDISVRRSILIVPQLASGRLEQHRRGSGSVAP
jgi:hypothetical protein